jgi:surface antigen
MRNRILYHRYVALPLALGRLQLQRSFRLILNGQWPAPHFTGGAWTRPKPVVSALTLAGLAAMGYFGGGWYAEASAKPQSLAVVVDSPTPLGSATPAPTPTSSPEPTPAPATPPPATPMPAAPISKPAAAPVARTVSQTAITTGYVNRYTRGYCTWYVANRRQVPPFWGDAVNWYYNAQASGYKVGNVPAQGAIAWLIGGNHVAYVEQVSGSNIYISEMNFNGNWNAVTSRWAPASSFRYIY